ncbi:uncharacterized protein RJT21DRAFT_123330 [Scheffersomyces amazonensis]|uniref:uncharacterized protein n=1 Tax=Scheffersomyces amazonensis TaxID=1078765 RepID=UPI00315C7DE7
MTVEVDIKKGETALVNRDYLGAIGHFTSALKTNPKAFQALIHRASAYIRLKNYDEAKKDISTAYTIAEERGKRDDIALSYFRLGNVYFLEKKYKLALDQIEKALAINKNDTQYQMWKAKCEFELKNNPQQDENEEEEDELDLLAGIKQTEPISSDVKDIPKIEEIKDISDKPSTSIDVINQQAPLKIKIRDDWYQTNDTVIITIYAKGIKEEKLNIEFNSHAVSVSFPSSSSSEYSYNLDPLYAEIDQTKSSYKIYGTKIEINLVKKVQKKWHTLEGSGNEEESIITTTTTTTSNEPVITNTTDTSSNTGPLSYPSSSKKAVNWANFKITDDDEKEADENDFFKKLYKDVDDDTRRAMMKSYVESNGTVLTTNWTEAKDKKFETSPPDGMVAKKWGT